MNPEPSKTRRLVVSAVVLVIVFGAGGAAMFFASRSCPQKNYAVFIRDPKQMSPGYTLVTPYYQPNAPIAWPGQVSLLDDRGRVVHSWSTKLPVWTAKLENNGNIMAAMRLPSEQKPYQVTGTTGVLAEQDWNGKVLWTYEDPDMYSDFDILPDGSVVYAKWERAPASFAKNVQGGLGTTTEVYTNGLVVVNRDKKVVWTWHAYDHLNPKDFPMSPLVPRRDWSHTNSIQYTPSNPLTHTPAFLVSMRHISTVFLIDAKSGAVLWQSPKGLLSLEHDATLTPAGTVMAFDNGLYRPGFPVLMSRVVEMDPRTNKVVWEYSGGDTVGERAIFASSVMGGAERLPNGNTLVTLSTPGRIFEVTPQKKEVWEYVSDFRRGEGFPARILFKARKYDPQGTAWGSLLPAAPLVNFCAR